MQYWWEKTFLYQVQDADKMHYFSFFQTITGAMSTLSPPVALEKPENQARVDYIQDYASGEISTNHPHTSCGLS